jgi:hypothetical protein
MRRLSSRPRLGTDQSIETEPTPARAGWTSGWRRLHLSRPAAVEGGVYALAIALVMWPGLMHARTRIFGGSDDARYYTWLGWRMGRLIAHGHIVPLRIADVIHPFGFDLRLVDGYLPSYVSGLYNVVAGPYLAYNLAFVTGAVLNVVSARALARRLSPRRLVHTIAAVAFLTAPPIGLSVQVGVLPLFWAFTVPLLLADGLDVVTGARAVRPVRLAVLLAVAYLCSVYFLVFGGVAYGVLVGIAAVRRRSWRIPLTTVAATAVTLVLLLPFVVPRIRFDRAEQLRGSATELLADSELYSADALSTVAQPTRSTFLVPRPEIVARSLGRLPDRTHALEETIFPGLLLLAGFTAFCFLRDRRRLPLILAAGIMWVFALGPSLKFGNHFVWEHAGKPVSWLPYRLLLALPGLGALRAPVRASYVLVGILVAATAIGLDRALDRWRANTIVVAAVAAALLATNMLIPLPTVTIETTAASEAAFHEIARLARPGDTVLRVPADCDPTFASYQLFHHAPVVGCAGSFAANPWSKLVSYTRSVALTKLRCDRTQYGRLTTSDNPAQPIDARELAQLRTDFGVRFLVIDHSFLQGRCPAVNASLPILETYRSLGHDGRFDVLDLSAPHLNG